MSNATKEWNDSINRGFEYIEKFLPILSKERSQLYGTIILLMLQNGIKAVELPPISEFQELGEKYYVLYHERDGKFYATLKEQESTEEETN